MTLRLPGQFPYPKQSGPGSNQAARGNHTHASADIAGLSNGTTPHTHVEGDVTSLVTDLASKLTDPTTTKGDLLTRNGSAVTRLAAGTDTFVLTADSSQATGLKWATVPATTPSFASLEKYRVD